MKLSQLCSALAVLSLFGIALQPVAAAEKPAKSAPAKSTAAAPLAKFMHSTKDTYGWSPVKGTISYDFFPDGRVHIQGPDGEASMAEGKWSLEGDMLTIVEKGSGKKTKLRAERDGDDLLLGEQRYRRYRP